MSTRSERLAAASRGRARGDLTRRGALRALLGVGAVAVTGGALLRTPGGALVELAEEPDTCPHRRPLASSTDCPSARIPKRNYTPVTNGCGAAKGWDYVPDMPGGYSFVAPCVAHDICYGTCGSDRDECDRAFHRDMVEVCDTHAAYGYDSGTCYSFAAAYYKAVAWKGAEPFAEGQVEGCDCCEDEPPPTTEPPPPLCARCSCTGTVYDDYMACIDACHAGLGCYTGICEPVACP